MIHQIQIAHDEAQLREQVAKIKWDLELALHESCVERATRMLN